ncbi:MAG: helix-turn-helix transcriptional regulator [Treponema sp.]|nr:helix-turn-helix transcriptional regulator [Treponema sp.]
MKSDFRRYLRAELDFRGLTVRDLSDRTGIPMATLNSYIGARASMPPADVAVRIAVALDVSVEFLVTGRDSGRPAKPQERLSDLRLLGGDVRAVVQLLGEMDGREVGTMLGIARVLRKQSEKPAPEKDGTAL